MSVKNLVSVLMPVKNEALYLGEAIQSLLNQSYRDIEVVLVDDGSEDRTMEIARSYAAEDSRVKVYRNPCPGKVRAFNMAYRKSTGDFFAFFAGDDILPIDSIAARVSPLLGRGEEALSACKLVTMSDDKRFNGVVTPRNEAKGVLSGGTILFNKAFARNVFPVPEVLPNEDLWPSLYAEYRDIQIYHVPEIGLYYRIHGENSHKRTDTFREKTEFLHKRFIVYGIFLEKYRSDLSAEQQCRLASLAAAETLRYSGSTLSILCMGNLSLADKARFLFYSTAFLYWFRIRFFSFFSGRG